MLSQTGVLCALGASAAWALGTVLSFKPAARLGALALTRVQIASSALVLLLIATLFRSWASVEWRFWPALLISSVIGVLVPNLAFIACLRRTGPGVTQVLFATRTPITALLGFMFFGQALARNSVLAIVLVSLGVGLAAGAGGAAAGRGAPLQFWKGVAWGALAAVGNAVGIVALLPAVDAGMQPLAISALRTTLAAAMLIAIGRLPWLQVEAPRNCTRADMLSAILPGLLGYVVAVTLQLWSLVSLDAGISVALSSLAPILVLPIMWAMTRKAARPLAWLGAGVVCGGVALLRVS